MIQTLILSLLALILGVAKQSGAQTIDTDKAALLAFKASVIDAGRLLSSWTEDTDPCVDDWAGIKCNCFPFFEDTTSAERPQICTPPVNTTSPRVLQLHLGDVRLANWNVLTGSIPAVIGDLAELRVLNLKSHNFTGPIPSTLEQLSAMEVLVLSENQLTGPMPPYLAQMKNLRYVYLDSNKFTGPLPTTWCSSWWLVELRNNSGICDEVPICLLDRVVSLEGTSLIDPVGDTDLNLGGYCDVVPPSCRRSEDACWVQGPDPPFWVNTTSVAFSFPEFRSAEGGVATMYEYSIGFEPGSTDVLSWTKLSGDMKTLTQSAEVKDSTTGQPIVTTQTVNIVNEPLPPAVALRDGYKYYVSVRGSNAGGPLVGTVASSDAISVDSSTPYLPPGAAVYSGEYFNNQPAQTATNGLGVSWDPFVDVGSGIDYYSYQVFGFQFNYASRTKTKYTSDYVGETITDKIRISDKNKRSLYISKLALNPGQSYFVRIYATNKYGAESSRDAPPVSIVTSLDGVVTIDGGSSEGVSVSKVVVLIAALVGATSAVVAMLSFWFAKGRFQKRQMASRKYQGQLRNLRVQMQSLVDDVGSAEAKKIEELRSLKDVALVITDLENSTGIASAAPRAYERVQEAHDTLMRDLISTFGGYEINTEGDAFHVVFKSVASAVRFCMEVQYEMMEIDWPHELLQLPGCKEVKGPDGILAFRGPRVRMALHWAMQGSVVQHVHQLTKHRVFTGPAFQVVRDLCECAYGGQVLLSHAAWELLRVDMAAASFPVVEQMGLFKLSTKKDPLWVYQVKRLLGRPLHRSFANKLVDTANNTELTPVVEGSGLLNIPIPFPENANGGLAFVACRIATEVLNSSSTATEMPAGLYSRIQSVVATVAQQFSGYVFRASDPQAPFLLAFAKTLDAVRFCHAAQILMAYLPWPNESSEWYGATEMAPDGTVIFKGPRIAMAIHESNDYSTRPVPRPRPSPDDPHAAIDYLGPAEEAVRSISEVAHGGQVILSESAWSAVQDQLPGQPQVISLGTHWVDEPCFPRPVMLMEVMPSALVKRSFPPPRNTRPVDAGYRDAPDAQSDVAIVHMKVDRPKEVSTAEVTVAEKPDDAAALKTLAAYSAGVARAVKVVRSMLPVYNGYECKETEAGRLTLAFRYLEDAVRWACAFQESLLDISWPDEVLSWEGCMEETEEAEYESTFDKSSDGDAQNSYVIWRGLRVQIGISFGLPTSKSPLKTGRADYFGALPNLAARLCSMAQPGQVLVDGARVGGMRGVKWREGVGILVGSSGLPGPSNTAVEVTMLGPVPVRGMDETRIIYQALPLSLRGRHFGDSLLRKHLSAKSITDTAFSETSSPRAIRQVPRVFASISRTGSATSARANRAASYSSRISDAVSLPNSSIPSFPWMQRSAAAAAAGNGNAESSAPSCTSPRIGGNEANVPGYDYATDRDYHIQGYDGRDVFDLSMPNSIVSTPHTGRAQYVDHWDASFQAEAAYKRDGLPPLDGDLEANNPYGTNRTSKFWQRLKRHNAS